MRALTIALILSLSGCANMVQMPTEASFHFACQDTTLIVAAELDTITDGAYVAAVGHCIGKMMIVGPARGTGA